MQITSIELWDTLEISLIQLKNKNIDQILSNKIESLINHFNSLMVTNRQFILVDEIRVIMNTISGKSFAKTRNLDKEDIKDVTSINESLSLLEKILLYESKLYKKELEEPNKDRLPNVNNDKSLNILKDEDNANGRKRF